MRCDGDLQQREQLYSRNVSGLGALFEPSATTLATTLDDPGGRNGGVLAHPSP